MDRTTKRLLVGIATALWGLLLRPLFISLPVQAAQAAQTQQHVDANPSRSYEEAYETDLQHYQTSGDLVDLEDLAQAAYHAHKYDQANRYAVALLKHAKRARKFWYYGNLLHHGNLILGRLALRSDHIQKADTYLLAAAETPGSPQLKSFGPDMSLAKELLERGEHRSVLDYLKRCAKFWHAPILSEWSGQIKAGGIPDFGLNLRGWN